MNFDLINIISCISSNGAVGYKQELIFNIKSDLQRFKKLTENQIVVMGMLTFKSIISRNGRILPNRTNVVLTRDKSYVSQYGEFVFHDVDTILKHIQTMGDTDKEVFIIGGNSLWESFMPHTKKIYLTTVNRHIEQADAYFPMKEMEDNLFIETTRTEHWSEEYDTFYSFVEYEKIPELDLTL